MTDGGDDTVELVAARLRELGLDHPAIDPAETATDLAERIAASASLDALVPGSGGPDPTAFDPSWPVDGVDLRTAGPAAAGPVAADL